MNRDREHEGTGSGTSRWDADEDRVREIREEERQRKEFRPFDYPYPERRANVRARRHISREEADADMPPGLSGSYGTTGGGQPAGPAHTPPSRSVTEEDPAGTVDRGDDGEGSGGTGR